MKKQITINFFILLISNLLIKPIWVFGIDRTIQNTVGASEYGLYFAVFNFSLLFGFLLDPGLNNFINRAISRDNNRLNSYLPNIFLLKLVLSAVYFVITFAFAYASGLNPFKTKLLLILITNQILLQFILYFRAQVAALQHFKIDAIFSILDRLLSIIFCCVLLIVIRSTQLSEFLIAQTFALLITMIVSGIYVFAQRKKVTKWWNFNMHRRVLKQTFWFAILAFLMTIYFRMDGILLEFLCTSKQAGIYAASYRILDAANMFAFLMSTILFPIFASNFKNKINSDEIIFHSFNLLWLGTTALITLCLAQSEFIIKSLYNESNSYWAIVFSILIPSFLPISSVYIFGTLLTAKGSLKALTLIALMGAILNIGLNIILITKYEAKGAAIATLISQILIAIFHIIAARKDFNITSFKNKIPAYITHLTICATIVVLSLNYKVHFLTSLIAIVLCLPLCMVIFKLIEIHPIIQLVKNKTK